MSASFDAEQLAGATGGRVLASGPAGPMGTDTRSDLSGRWFVALRGPHFDGHDHLMRARDAGAVGCVVEREPPEGWQGGVVVVANARDALASIAAAARRRYKGPVVGITGSSGKTTTRGLVTLALRPLMGVHHTRGNLNNRIGVPLTLLNGDVAAGAWVVEMGTSEPGEIEALSACATPNVRLIVNVGPSHLEGLGDLEGVAREKGALFSTARAGDVCCVRIDDPLVASMPLPQGVRRVTWGHRGDVALVRTAADVEAREMTAVFDTPQGRVKARLPGLAKHVAIDAAGALAVAFSLGVDVHTAAEQWVDYEPEGSRMRWVDLPGGGVMLNDAYNANPASTLAAVRTLASLPGDKTVVLGDMLELGDSEDRWHREVAEEVAGLRLDRVILVGERFARRGVREVLPHATAFSTVDDAIEAWSWRPERGQTVLLKASRGVGLDRLAQRLTEEPER